MTFAKKLRQIVVVFFLINLLTSCEQGCYQADEYYSEVFTLQANPKNYTHSENSNLLRQQVIYGNYNNNDGGQSSDWADTGLIANGGPFLIAVSGGWIANGGANITNVDQMKGIKPCKLCIKNSNSPSVDNDNCFCGPVLENGSLKLQDTPEVETYTQNGVQNLGKDANGANIDCSTASSPHLDKIDYCTCKKYSPSDDANVIKDLQKSPFFLFSTASVKKRLNSLQYEYKAAFEQDICMFNMGVGAYIGLFGIDGNTLPQFVYQMFSTDRFCPANIFKNGVCLDETGSDRSKFLYRSPGNRIFVKNDSNPSNTEYHSAGEVVRLNIYDQFYHDNAGSYKIEFLSGVIQKNGGGLLADIVSTMDKYLFGETIYDRALNLTVKKAGIVEFMYKSVLSDPIVSNVVTISLVLYVCFYGLGFFIGIVDFGRKEVMMRILKIGLVVLFTNKNAWQMYNTLVVDFFKTGMDSVSAMITTIFEKNMERSLSLIMANETTNDGVATKFVFIDNMIKDFLSKANIARIFGLLVMQNGKGFFALILIPCIFALIFYFLYTMLDVALKYLINLFKICLGLALGPVFILFSLFEKTKDMFKNWLSFLGSRVIEIIFLIAMIHPFLLIIDNSFRMMMGYKVCTHNIGTNYMQFLIYKAEGIQDRTLFQWFEYFLRIAALIFITKSVADKSSYISGQLISIGGVANADPVTETGHGASGFSFASMIAKGAVSAVKQALSSKYVGGAVKAGLRAGATGLTSLGRTEIGRAGSINDMVNDAFKFVGIRNRGVRSYLRDRQVDKEIALASLRADDLGLKGQERSDFIRADAMKSINIFRNNNKNHAAILGLDNHNIAKRFDQKLVKEPMKNFIKEKAQELKSQGVIGKEARNILKSETQQWAKENLSGGNPDRKVADFFKKSSMKNFLRKNSEMSAKEAINYSKDLLDSGKQDEAKQFIDSFRENSTRNILRREKGEQDSVKAGGKVVKAVTNVLGAFGVDKQALNNAIPKFIKTPLGKIDNYVGKARREAKTVGIPFVGNSGGVKSNPKNNLRKFDRKFTRMMAEKMNDNQVSKEQKQTLQEKFALPDNLKAKKSSYKTFMKIDEKDNALSAATKFVAKAVFSPIIVPALKAKQAYKNRFVYKDEFKNIKYSGNSNSLRSIIAGDLEKLDKNLDAQLKFSKESFTGFKQEKININGESLDVNYYKDKKADTQEQFEKNLQELKDYKIYNKSIRNLELALGKFDENTKKSQKLDTKTLAEKLVAKEVAKVINNKTLDDSKEAKISPEEEQKIRAEKEQEINREKIEDLKKFNKEGGKDETTIFETLSRLEQSRDELKYLDKSDLKYKFQEEINKIIEQRIKDISDKTLQEKMVEIDKLNKLKNSLTTDVSSSNYDDVRDDIKKAFAKTLENLGKNQDSVGSDDDAKSKGEVAQKSLIALDAGVMKSKNTAEAVYEGYEKIIKFRAQIELEKSNQEKAGDVKVENSKTDFVGGNELSSKQDFASGGDNKNENGEAGVMVGGQNFGNNNQEFVVGQIERKDSFVENKTLENNLVNQGNSPNLTKAQSGLQNPTKPPQKPIFTIKKETQEVIGKASTKNPIYTIKKISTEVVESKDTIVGEKRSRDIEIERAESIGAESDERFKKLKRDGESSKETGNKIEAKLADDLLTNDDLVRARARTNDNISNSKIESKISELGSKDIKIDSEIATQTSGKNQDPSREEANNINKTNLSYPLNYHGESSSSANLKESAKPTLINIDPQLANSVEYEIKPELKSGDSKPYKIVLDYALPNELGQPTISSEATKSKSIDKNNTQDASKSMGASQNTPQKAQDLKTVKVTKNPEKTPNLEGEASTPQTLEKKDLGFIERETKIEASKYLDEASKELQKQEQAKKEEQEKFEREQKRILSELSNLEGKGQAKDVNRGLLQIEAENLKKESLKQELQTSINNTIDRAVTNASLNPESKNKELKIKKLNELRNSINVEISSGIYGGDVMSKIAEILNDKF